MATLFNTKIKDTYQSLLKLEDNTILTTTSKNITDGLGNASPLYMSTTRIGIGTNTPANTLSVVGADSVNNLGVYGASGRLQIRGYLSATYGTLFESTTSGGALMPTTISASKILLLDGQVGINTTSTGAQLHIKGTGSTSATTSLLVQNSSANTLLQVLDNGLVYVGTANTGLSFSGSNTQIFNNGGSGGRISFAMGGVSYIEIYQPINNGGGFTSGTLNNITTPFTYTNTSGAVSYNLLSISPGINNTGTYVGTIRGIYYNPSLTSLVGTTHIALETVTGDVLLTTTSGQVGIGSVYGGWRLNVDGAIRAQRIDLTGSAGPGHVMLRIDDNGTVLRNNTFNINSGNGNAGQNANLAVGNTDSTLARLYVKGSGTTSSTTSLWVQNSSNVDLLKITDDSTFYFKGASGTTLRIKSGIETNSSTIQFNNEGLSGGYSGGYTFTNGFGGNYGTVVSLRIYPGKVGIGNITEGTMQNNAMNLYVDNTQTGGRNKAIKLNVNFANISTEYNGIQFDTIENGSGGAFIGSQYNTATSSYGSDLAIFTTTESSTYTETARFVGKSQSLSIGAGKNPTARLHVVGTGSTSATSSLLVQNSSGNRLLETKDNGDLYVGNTASNTGTIYVPHSPTFVDRVFMRIDGGFPLFSTVSNALLEISCSQFYTQGNMAMRNANQGIIGQVAVQTNNSSIQLTTSVNAYNGTNQDDACNLLYIKNNGVTLQAGGSVNFLKLDGTVNEAGGGGVKFCTGIYYNPTLTGGALLANSHYCYHATSGQMMVNTTSPQASAQLQVDSTTRGVLFPRMTTAQKLAIASPVGGLQVFDTTLNQMSYYNGSAWINF